jgi:predicted negative regulator of RcsB-dependent stress response
MKSDWTKIVIVLVVLVVLGVAGYFGFRAVFGSEKVSFDFNPLKNFQAVAYKPIPENLGEVANA